jgi:hypothetical protein
MARGAIFLGHRKFQKKWPAGPFFEKIPIFWGFREIRNPKKQEPFAVVIFGFFKSLGKIVRKVPPKTAFMVMGIWG